MSVFDELETLYQEIDNEYSRLEFLARTRGWTKKELLYRCKRELNDQAYFLFMFSRLEDHIRTQSDKLIQKKKSLKQPSTRSWQQQTPWDILSSLTRKDRFSLMDRVTLLMERGCKDYQLVKEYYEERNSIAHGGSFTKIRPISMPTVISELKRLYKKLKA